MGERSAVAGVDGRQERMQAQILFYVEREAGLKAFVLKH